MPEPYNQYAALDIHTFSGTFPNPVPTSLLTSGRLKYEINPPRRAPIALVSVKRFPLSALLTVDEIIGICNKSVMANGRTSINISATKLNVLGFKALSLMNINTSIIMPSNKYPWAEVEITIPAAQTAAKKRFFGFRLLENKNKIIPTMQYLE